MVAGTNRKFAYIAFVGAMAPLVIAVYYAADMFLPMYRWLKVDLKQIGAATGVAEAKLATKYKLKVRYNPRGEGDPLPWQIYDCQPPWQAADPKDDETDLLVRCTFVSGNDGKPPSTTFINSTFKDRYWTCEAIRLPPGVLGFNKKRPVIIYDQMSMSKSDITTSDMAQRTLSLYKSDDDVVEWSDRDDGYRPPDQQ